MNVVAAPPDGGGGGGDGGGYITNFPPPGPEWHRKYAFTSNIPDFSAPQPSHCHPSSDPVLAVSATAPHPLLLGTPLGEFEVTRSLGSGSYGKVKLVRNVLNGSVVAVKIVNRFAVEARTDASHPDHRRAVTLDKRVAREANLSQVLGGLHPNIVPLELLRVTERHFYLFYRYIDGMNLADLVNLAAENSNSSGITGGIGERLARPLIRQVIETVAFCHAHSVVHRDIKLDNLMVDNTGRVHLIDFGLAHFYAQESQLKTFCGSLPYTAPELIRGLKYTGPEVDVWSLGVTLYRLVLGRFPFGDPMDDACWAQILASEFPAPPVHECTQTFHDLLRRMLRASPRSRAPLALIMMHPWWHKDITRLAIPHNRAVAALSGKVGLDIGRLLQADHVLARSGEPLTTSESKKSVQIPRVLDMMAVRETAVMLERTIEDVEQTLINAIQRAESVDIVAGDHPLHGTGYLSQQLHQLQPQHVKVPFGPVASMYALILDTLSKRATADWLDSCKLPPLDCATDLRLLLSRPIQIAGSQYLATHPQVLQSSMPPHSKILQPDAPISRRSTRNDSATAIAPFASMASTASPPTASISSNSSASLYFTPPSTFRSSMISAASATSTAFGEHSVNPGVGEQFQPQVATRHTSSASRVRTSFFGLLSTTPPPHGVRTLGIVEEARNRILVPASLSSSSASAMTSPVAVMAALRRVMGQHNIAARFVTSATVMKRVSSASRQQHQYDSSVDDYSHDSRSDLDLPPLNIPPSPVVPQLTRLDSATDHGSSTTLPSHNNNGNGSSSSSRFSLYGNTWAPVKSPAACFAPAPKVAAHSDASASSSHAILSDMASKGSSSNSNSNSNSSMSSSATILGKCRAAASLLRSRLRSSLIVLTGSPRSRRHGNVDFNGNHSIISGSGKDPSTLALTMAGTDGSVISNVATPATAAVTAGGGQSTFDKAVALATGAMARIGDNSTNRSDPILLNSAAATTNNAYEPLLSSSSSSSSSSSTSSSSVIGTARRQTLTMLVDTTSQYTTAHRLVSNSSYVTVTERILQPSAQPTRFIVCQYTPSLHSNPQATSSSTAPNSVTSSATITTAEIDESQSVCLRLELCFVRSIGRYAFVVHVYRGDDERVRQFVQWLRMAIDRLYIHIE